MDFNFNKFKPKKNRQIFRIFFYLIVLSIFLLLLFFILTLIFKKPFSVKNNKIKNPYKTLFNEKNYEEVIRKIDIELKKNPFNEEFLIFRGYSYFLLLEDEKDILKKKKYLMISLFDLKKALAIGVNSNNNSNLYFIIGKIYFYLGEAYYYQSLDYLNRSLNTGNKRKDLYYVLGILNSYIGNYKEAIKFFLEILKTEESDLVLLSVGTSYYKDNDFENAKIYLEKVNNISSNTKIKEKSLFLYGEILFNEKKYDLALESFTNVIELNENNASAYFYRGEIYFNQNNILKARAEWRKTLEIDPTHIKALKRIYY